MRFLIAAVGKPRNRALAAAIAEYEERAARYWPLEICEVREEPARGVSPERVRDREGERLLACVDARAHVIACDAGGVHMTSEEFAAWLQREREQAAHDVALTIGGAYGLSDAIRTRAVMQLSFSSWTLPHELARLVLAEQLYRAGTIVRGEPYHK
ncbi:MAG TPA: 23S rRNA (pseudouridine(1915)-N(3))-methyltransferase RlmH [Gemmatimonadaceae bacterium]|jgi:23S rRNA (pseudouridine1915-N3)-methyltransferase|nr:23S rRNA (pseudouridine(1915)-N(3))-methyltransferase RlmH [Gemmatimonadaceae bacterium]